MKSYFLTALLLAAIVFACNQLDKPGDVADQPIPIHFCPDTTHNDLCPLLPYDVSFPFLNDYSAFLDPNIQPAFDVFSWQSFVGLNWPADSTGKPIGNNIGDHPSALRVWEYYPDIAEIFGGDEPLLLKAREAKGNKQKLFYMLSKMPKRKDSLSDVLNPDGKPLIDRNLNFAVFAVNANPIEANFIISNNLTTQQGIDTYFKKHHDSFALPASVRLQKGRKASEGSIEIKTSWRILDTAKGDVLSRYYTREALIFVDAENSASNKSFTIKATVGLTGMHIVRKTERFLTWVWSTFEHVDNTPDNIQDAQMQQDSAKRWSYYNIHSLGLTPNQPAAHRAGDNGSYKFDSVAPYAKRYATAVFGEADSSSIYGSQAQRVYPIYYRTQQVNKAWQQKLQGTVWANYKLIGSQWTATYRGSKANANVPFFLGNSSMETFQLINASCISCHQDAYIQYGKDSIPTDFSFLVALHAK